MLEKRTGKKIVIGAHPRSQYEQHPDYFGGRLVARGKTVELVKDAAFVILHWSTAVNFAVLFRKPLLFITTNEIEESEYSAYAIVMASAFGKRVINLNNTSAIDWDKELAVDEEAYDKYKNRYIKRDGTEELPFWQIVANYLKNLNYDLDYVG
jgi:hypothetical protein